MTDFLVSVLGFATFLLIAFWIFSVFAFASWFESQGWYWKIAEARRKNLPFLATVLGGITIWLCWEFVLPDWWKAATPLMSYE